MANPQEASDIDGYRLNDDGSLTVYRSAVPWQWRFKCICIYNDDAWGVAQETIYRSDSEYDLEIEKYLSNNSLSTFLRVVNHKNYTRKNDNIQWGGTWYLQLADNSYTRVEEPYHHGGLDITNYVVQDVVTFRVAAYDPYKLWPTTGDPKNPLISTNPSGYLDYTVGFDNDLDLTIDWEGIKQFNYTAGGQAYNKDTLVGCELTPKLKWLDNKMTTYAISILAPDGHILGPGSTMVGAGPVPEATGGVYPAETLQGYNPPGSMMKDMWVDSNHIVHFNVYDEYDADKVLNTLIAIVQVGAETYRSDCDVIFTKDGQQGTQGSGWSAPLRLTTARQSGYIGMDTTDPDHPVRKYAHASFLWS